MASKLVLLVVDPAKGTNKAIETIGSILNRFSRAGEMELVTLITTNIAGLDQNTSNVSLNKSWVDDLLKMIDDGEYKNTPLLCWSGDWADTVLEHSDTYSTEFSIIPFYDHRSANILSDQKWKFLRNTKSPVLLTNGPKPDASHVILAAIKSQDPNYEESNQRVLQAVDNLAIQVGSEVHIVNAYSGSMDYPDRAKIANLAGIANDKIHVEEGSVSDVLCSVAEQLNADAIYIGNQQRKGLSGSFKGNTVEKIIERSCCDIVMA